MELNNSTESNRELYSDELYFLLKKLGVVGASLGGKDKEFIEIFRDFDGCFGNPADSKSMFNLIWLLEKLDVDVDNEVNLKIIEEAVYNKKSGVMNYEEENRSESTKVINSLFSSISACTATKWELDNYISILMYQLGFKPNLSGFTFFKDGVMYLLENEVASWSKVIYPSLGKKYHLAGKYVERDLRHLIEVGIKKHSNNEVCCHVYGNKEHITNSECLCSVVDYIKSKDKYLAINVDEMMKIDSISQDFNVNGELEKRITYIFKALGFSSRFKGYNYLYDAVIYLLKVKEPVTLDTVYSEIASVYATTKLKVERNIRNVIEMNSDSFTDNEVSKYVYRGGMNITISECLASVLEYINLTNKDKQMEIMDIDKNLEQVVTKVIYDLGIPANIRGYYYLRVAILYVLKNNGPVLWGDLYNEIGDLYSSSYSKVERGIGVAIDKCRAYYESLSRGKFGSKQMPVVLKFVHNYNFNLSNSEFIALVAEYIRLTDKEQLLLNYATQKNGKIVRNLVRENAK